MAQSRTRGAGVTHTEHEIRAQEVLRASRELAAYFKGRRTEREARAALKIIKAFVKARERMPVDRRPSLPLVLKGQPRSSNKKAHPVARPVA